MVSIKPDRSVTGSFKAGFSSEGISAQNASLLMIIRWAYGMFNSLDDKFAGIPDWAKTDKYDIEAKVDPSELDAFHKSSREQRDLMLQALLADYFKLKVHRETREQPIYALVIAKNGPKIRQAKAGDTYPNGLTDPYDGRTGPGVTRGSSHSLAGQAIAIPDLAIMLTQIVGRTVDDRTGLKGAYDFNLDWTPDSSSVQSATTDMAGPSSGDLGPSIFTAIQDQLGLRLEPTKGPTEVLVIDRIQRPAAN